MEKYCVKCIDKEKAFIKKYFQHEIKAFLLSGDGLVKCYIYIYIYMQTDDWLLHTPKLRIQV